MKPTTRWSCCFGVQVAGVRNDARNSGLGRSGQLGLLLYQGQLKATYVIHKGLRVDLPREHRARGELEKIFVRGGEELKIEGLLFKFP